MKKKKKKKLQKRISIYNFYFGFGFGFHWLLFPSFCSSQTKQLNITKQTQSAKSKDFLQIFMKIKYFVKYNICKSYNYKAVHKCNGKVGAGPKHAQFCSPLCVDKVQILVWYSYIIVYNHLKLNARKFFSKVNKAIVCDTQVCM